MGRFLLLMCAGGLLIGTLAMGSTRRSVVAQDQRLSAHEAEVVARENALSALNQVLPFVQLHFDQLVTGQVVNLSELTSQTSSRASSSGGVLASLGNRLTLDGSTIQLVLNRIVTLLPTQEVANGSAQQATVQLLSGNRLEVTTEGIAMVGAIGGVSQPVRHRIRRTFSRLSPFDAALTVVAPLANVAFSGDNLVDGRDVDPVTLAPANVQAYWRPGISTNARAVAERFGAVVGSGNRHRVVGVHGEGDIVYGALQSDVDQIFDEAFTYSGASRVNVATNTLSGNLTYGSATDPKVVVRNGNLEIAGEVQGHGVLVVNGDLRVTTGRLVWTGLVLVRKSTSEGNVQFALSNQTQIVGAAAVIQGASSVVMPFAGRVSVRYISSTADMLSSVHVQHTHEGTLTFAEIATPGSNRTGDFESDYAADLAAGEQVALAIGARYARWSSLNGQLAYYHWGRGHFSPTTALPYGTTTLTAPYTYLVGFEDKDSQFELGYGLPEFNYTDQVAEITIQCRAYTSNGSLRTVAGAPVYETCTPDNPDAQAAEAVSLDWNGLNASSGVVATPAAGTQASVSLTGARVLHSPQALAPLATLLPSLGASQRLVTLSTWAGS